MTKVDFYLLSASGAEQRLRFACRLVEQIYRRRSQKVYLHADDDAMAHELDERLWHERDHSFLPHHLVGDGPEPPPPIQVGYREPPAHRDILINLAGDIPDFFSQFTRVAEIVDEREEIKTQLRDHYRFYRDRGYHIDTHPM